jgi:hypothetical protein
MDPVEAQCLSESFHFVYVSLDSPKRHVLGLIRLATPKLIEKDNGPIRRKRFK